MVSPGPERSHVDLLQNEFKITNFEKMISLDLSKVHYLGVRRGIDQKWRKAEERLNLEKAIIAKDRKKKKE